MDFTLDKYVALLDALKCSPFSSLTLRHDVDRRLQNSLRAVWLEADCWNTGLRSLKSGLY